MADETSARLGMPLLHAGQAQKEVAHNEALTLLDMIVQAGVESADAAAPPGAPVAGQCWIVAAGASGAWAGHDGDVAGWTGGGWRFVAPRAGMRIRVADRDHAMVHDGAVWMDDAVRADGYYQGGARVIAARQDAIPDPAGGGVIDVEGRAGIVAILAAMRAHGLIDAA